jgi:hypothetical protein
VTGLIVSMRNHPFAGDAIGFAVPFSWALLLVMIEAPVVVTAGMAGVVNDSTEPKAVPEAFDVIAQK